MKKILLGIGIGLIIGYLTFPLVYMMLTGDFPGYKIFYGLQEDSWIVDFLLNLIGV